MYENVPKHKPVRQEIYRLRRKTKTPAERAEIAERYQAGELIVKLDVRKEYPKEASQILGAAEDGYIEYIVFMKQKLYSVRDIECFVAGMRSAMAKEGAMRVAQKKNAEAKKVRLSAGKNPKPEQMHII